MNRRGQNNDVLFLHLFLVELLVYFLFLLIIDEVIFNQVSIGLLEV